MTLTYRYGSRRSQAHAFSVERTNGDHFVWTCACGHVVIQDPGDREIIKTLIEHATEGKR
jgi:hypothetical protein